jgi:hypothetical protein
MRPKKETQKSATPSKKSGGFKDEEKAEMRNPARELTAEALVKKDVSCV